MYDFAADEEVPEDYMDVTRSPGVDVVDVGDKCLANYGDIRFTNSTGTELDYWMETNAGSYADFWVEIDSIGTSTNIYIYYGISSASTTSNGDTTFIFFDDFTGTALDTGKWTSAGTPVISSSILTLNTTSGTPTEGIASISTFGTNYAIRTRTNIPSVYNVGFDAV